MLLYLTALLSELMPAVRLVIYKRYPPTHLATVHPPHGHIQQSLIENCQSGAYVHRERTALD